MVRVLRLMLLISLASHCGQMTCAESGNFREGFEGPETTWQLSGGDAAYRVTRHERTRGQFHSGLGSESIRIAANPGESVFASHRIPASRIIAEVVASVWVKADRPGLQILGRIVLPRSRDASTGRPVTLLIRGSGYTQAGAWQLLRLDDLPRQVERQARVARVNLGRKIDVHEAYLDQVLLNIYGGPGATEVAIDDLELSGCVAVDAVIRDGDVRRASANQPTGEDRQAGDARDQLEPARAQQGVGSRLKVRVAGAQLLVGDRPFFPRMIEFRGEPLDRLKKLGFNAVRLNRPPTRQQLDEARSAGMWLVCPPPSAGEFESPDRTAERPQIDAQYDAVLAWDFCEPLRNEDFDAVRQWAKAIRAADPARRPLLGDREEGLRGLSRYVEVLFPERFPLGSSLEIADYGKWLAQRQQLARPGTPFWTTIQTELAPQWQRQWTTLTGQPAPSTVQDAQVRQLVYTALAAGARGLSFQGATPLTADEPTSRRRATILEWINLELGLVEPWATHGNFLTMAEGSDPSLSAVVLQTPQARLIAPVSRAPGSQFVSGAGVAGGASLTIPGGQAADQAFELTPAGLRPLARQRVAGGLRITLGNGDRTSLVVLTQNSAVVGELTKQVASTRRRAAELERQLALQEFAGLEGVVRRLPAGSRGGKEIDADLTAARTALGECDAQLNRRAEQDSLASARRATQSLRHAERSIWERIAPPFSSTVAAPLAVSFATLPEHLRLVDQWRVAPLSQNRLAAGDFESLELMRRAGWKNLQFSTSQLVTLVEISPELPHEGIHSLHLSVRPAQAGPGPTIVEAPPVLVNSPDVAVELGQVYLIRGWVRVEQPISGSVDGLLISDSLGGDSLGERIGPASGWREFGFYRVAPQSGRLAVTFALTGLGEAWIDDVQIHALGAGQLANRVP